MNRPARTRAALAIATAALGLAGAPAREARADGGHLIEKGLFLPVGVNLGYSMNPRGAANGLLLGGEASVVWFTKGWWSGMYADGLRDFGEDEVRTSVGLEGGYGPLGVDFGYLGAFRDELMHGARARAIFTTALVALYGGYAHTWLDGRSHGELGVLLKLPLPVLTVAPKRPAPEPPPASAPPLPLAVPPEPLAPEPQPSAPEPPPAPDGPEAPEPAPPTAPPPPDTPPARETSWTR